jgi:hypothetical protein
MNYIKLKKAGIVSEDSLHLQAEKRAKELEELQTAHMELAQVTQLYEYLILSLTNRSWTRSKRC